MNAKKTPCESLRSLSVRCGQKTYGTKTFNRKGAPGTRNERDEKTLRTLRSLCGPCGKKTLRPCTELYLSYSEKPIGFSIHFGNRYLLGS